MKVEKDATNTEPKRKEHGKMLSTEAIKYQTDKGCLYCMSEVRDVDGVLQFATGMFYDVLDDSNEFAYEVLDHAGVRHLFSKDPISPDYYSNWFSTGTFTMSNQNGAMDNTKYWRADFRRQDGRVTTLWLVYYIPMSRDYIDIMFTNPLGELEQATGSVFRIIGYPLVETI